MTGPPIVAAPAPGQMRILRDREEPYGMSYIVRAKEGIGIKQQSETEGTCLGAWACKSKVNTIRSTIFSPEAGRAQRNRDVLMKSPLTPENIEELKYSRQQTQRQQRAREKRVIAQAGKINNHADKKNKKQVNSSKPTRNLVCPPCFPRRRPPWL